MHRFTLLLSLVPSLFYHPNAYSQDTLSGTILFKITHPESAHTSYLFGTHHAFGKAFFDTLSMASEALKSCDLVLKENLNIPGETADNIIHTRSEETNWKSFLQKDDLLYLQQLFANNSTFPKMTPAELHAFLIRRYNQTVCLQQDEEDNSTSLDDYIGRLAESWNTPLLGLETTADQLRYINEDIAGMPAKVHKNRLHTIINLLQTQDNSSCSSTDWYSAMNFDYQLQAPCTNTLMLTDRNNRWMKTLESKLQTNNCFIAVGLSHLMYECGLINQIRELGYTVSPVAVK